MTLALPFCVVVWMVAAPAEPSAPDAAALTTLLEEFLAGASRDDVAVHQRFWADELIYTTSSGLRKDKADILGELRSAARPAPTTTYTSEDVRIRQYGDTAIVAFRLVGTTARKGGGTEVQRYLNTGTFLKRDGRWQAVAWQATRMAPPVEPHN
jgi:ketosteroid isomerase-like protein